jgi:aminoglycoside/choline kinase family phosphotransferase
MESFQPFLDRYFETHFQSRDYRVFSLAGDASNRRYVRVTHDHQTWVLMIWEPFKATDYPFLSVLTHFAKHSVKVPQVEAMSESEGLVLLEDLGDLTLERKFWESQESSASLPVYKLALEELIKIHFHATQDRTQCTAFKLKFDVEKLLWEMNYGRTNLVEGMCKFDLTPAASKELNEVFVKICERIFREPMHIAHRDYHSRNIMLKFDEVRVIDFQDARLGAIQYDLVSLLRDSYVNMDEASEKQLLNYYLSRSKNFLPGNFSREHFDLIYEVQSIQRCFKACGSFSSFYNQRGDTRYLKYISGTLRRVLKSLAFFPEYKVFSDILIDSGALERKYDVP